MQLLLPPPSPSPRPHLLLQDLWRSLISPLSCLLLPCWQLLLSEELPPLSLSWALTVAAAVQQYLEPCCLSSVLPFSPAFPILFVLLLLMRLFKPLWLLQSCRLLWLPGASFPHHSCVKPVNSWNLAMSALLSTCLLVIWLQFYLQCCPENQPAPTSPCVSQQIALCLVAALPLRHCPLPSTDSLSASLPWGLDFAAHWSLAELVLCPWEDCCKSMVFPSRHLFLSVQVLLLALCCHSCLSLVL